MKFLNIFYFFVFLSVPLFCMNCFSASVSETSDDISGVWQLGPKAIIKIDKNPQNEWVALYYDTRPSSQIWFDLKDIKFENGIMTCNFPDFANSTSTYQGRLSENKMEIMHMTRENFWVAKRVEDPESISLMKNIESSIWRGAPKKYKYTSPEDVGDGWEVGLLGNEGFDTDKVTEMIDRIFEGRSYNFCPKYLFAPLGITDIWIQIYPEGTTDTDGGLCMRPRDLARIGSCLEIKIKGRRLEKYPEDATRALRCYLLLTVSRIWHISTSLMNSVLYPYLSAPLPSWASFRTSS